MVLQSSSKIKAGTNANNNQDYKYRWYGLYKVQKDLYATNANVGSLMISSKQWDAIMSYTGYGSATREADTYTTKPDLSGAVYKDVTPSTYDETHNIYDLAGNLYEWTIKASSTNYRTYRGGNYNYSNDSARYSLYDYPYRNCDPDYSSNYGSRLSLYIK